MDKIYGSGFLSLKGTLMHALLNMDFDDGVIEAYLKDPLPAIEDQMDVNKRKEIVGSDAVLKDVMFKLPYGTIKAAVIDNLFVSRYSPAGWSVDDTVLNRAFDFSGKSTGIASLMLTPRLSRLQFKYYPVAKYNELVYLNNNIRFLEPFCFKHDGKDIKVIDNNTGVSFSSDYSLNDLRPKLNLSWSVLQGSYLTHVFYLEGSDLVLSLEGKKVYQKGNVLYKKIKDVPDIFTALFKYILNLSPSEYKKWEKALKFYIDGKAVQSILDIRILNFFTFLEILDGSRTLNKESLSKMLAISNVDAYFVKNIRDLLVHNVHFLKEAISEGYRKIKDKHQSFTPEIFTMDGSGKHDAALFFCKLVILIDKYIINSIGYGGEWNDQGIVIEQLEREGEVCQDS